MKSKEYFGCEDKKKYTIVVLFTCYKDMASDFIYYISGKGYTHASIALEENPEYYYSFNSKGFRKEYPQRYKKRMRDKSASFYLEISEESYQKIRKRLMEMEAQTERYRYTRIGVLFCLLRIAWHRKDHYFCSEFVSELLRMAEGIQLRKKSSLYLPQHLARELEGMPCVKQIRLQSV